MTEWRPVPEWPYEVSDDGRIRNSSGRERKLTLCPKGYPKVDLFKGGEKRLFSVHSLVLLCFCGPRPDGLECAHRNGIPSDNRLENLYYATKKQNAQDKVVHGTMCRGESHVKSKLSESDVVSIKFDLLMNLSQNTIAEAYGVSRSCIQSIANGRTWKHV